MLNRNPINSASSSSAAIRIQKPARGNAAAAAGLIEECGADSEPAGAALVPDAEITPGAAVAAVAPSAGVAAVAAPAVGVVPAVGVAPASADGRKPPLPARRARTSRTPVYTTAPNASKPSSWKAIKPSTGTTYSTSTMSPP